MEKRENLEIKKVPESLTAQDLEKVTGGARTKQTCNKKHGCTKDDSDDK